MTAGTTRLTVTWLASLITLIVAGAGLAVLAGRTLSASEYSAFIAFTAVSGILVQGVGGAIEQHTLLHSRFGPGEDLASTLRIAVASYLLIVLVMVLPVGGWQDRFFEPLTSQVIWAVVIGTPALFMTCVVRGGMAARGLVVHVGRSILLLSAFTVLFPLVLRTSGLSWAVALIVGQAGAWGAPSLYLLKFRHVRGTEIVADPDHTKVVERLNSLFILNNLLLLGCLLSSQVVVKSTTTGISTDEVAQAQLIISLSCLSATLAIGAAPLILARAPVSVISFRSGYLSRIAVPGTGIAMVAVILIVVLRQTLVRVILGDTAVLGTGETLLLAVPGALLTMSVLLNSFLISNRMTKRALMGWSAGLAALWLPSALSSPDSITRVAVLVLAGTAVLFVTHLAALFGGQDIRQDKAGT